MDKLFIAGTDTDAGKTVVSVTLLHALQAQGRRCLALKPVAAGATWRLHEGQERWMNDDAEALQQALATTSHQQTYDQVNPYCFAEPIAPHIAAEHAEQELVLADILQHIRTLEQLPAEILVIEGAGGWLVPLNAQQSMADIAVQSGAQVILVVGLKLGCINHALLTAAAISASGANLVGWVANQPQPQPMVEQAANIASLEQRLSAPCLGVLPYCPTWRQGHLVDYLATSQLLQSLLAANSSLSPAKKA